MKQFWCFFHVRTKTANAAVVIECIGVHLNYVSRLLRSAGNSHLFHVSAIPWYRLQLDWSTDRSTLYNAVSWFIRRSLLSKAVWVQIPAGQLGKWFHPRFTICWYPASRHHLFLPSCFHFVPCNDRAHQIDLFIGETLMVFHQTHIKTIQDRPFHAVVALKRQSLLMSPQNPRTGMHGIESRILF